MQARVGKSVGAVRCQSRWVAIHVRGMWAAIRGSSLHIVALPIVHNALQLAEVREYEEQIFNLTTKL